MGSTLRFIVVEWKNREKYSHGSPLGHSSYGQTYNCSQIFFISSKWKTMIEKMERKFNASSIEHSLLYTFPHLSNLFFSFFAYFACGSMCYHTLFCLMCKVTSCTGFDIQWCISMFLVCTLCFLFVQRALPLDVCFANRPNDPKTSCPLALKRHCPYHHRGSLNNLGVS